MEFHTYLVNSQLEASSVEAWIEAGWLIPNEPDAGGFSEIDLARAQLIHDLTSKLGINDEGIPIILDLIDQLHGLRWAMRELLQKRGA